MQFIVSYGGNSKVNTSFIIVEATSIESLAAGVGVDGIFIGKNKWVSPYSINGAEEVEQNVDT